VVAAVAVFWPHLGYALFPGEGGLKLKNVATNSEMRKSLIKTDTYKPRQMPRHQRAQAHNSTI
jgi:hypothetical protein